MESSINATAQQHGSVTYRPDSGTGDVPQKLGAAYFEVNAKRVMQTPAEEGFAFAKDQLAHWQDRRASMAAELSQLENRAAELRQGIEVAERAIHGLEMVQTPLPVDAGTVFPGPSYPR